MSKSENKLSARAEISKQYKWSVEDIYPDEAAWETDYQRLEQMLPQLLLSQKVKR